jgi:hypothetical protein
MSSNAKAEVDRSPYEQYLTLSLSVERKVFDAPADSFGDTGICVLGVNVYTKPNHVSLAIFCGAGITGEWGGGA